MGDDAGGGHGERLVDVDGRFAVGDECVDELSRDEGGAAAVAAVVAHGFGQAIGLPIGRDVPGLGALPDHGRGVALAAGARHVGGHLFAEPLGPLAVGGAVPEDADPTHVAAIGLAQGHLGDEGIVPLRFVRRGVPLAPFDAQTRDVGQALLGHADEVAGRMRGVEHRRKPVAPSRLAVVEAQAALAVADVRVVVLDLGVEEVAELALLEHLAGSDAGLTVVA